ncbi:uncharacterized protein LOC121262371 isoform X2 [Juglans microcarpa x Juglans regia]|uniref:uncharacterized protein LOC121262371 isoform X2 n=1 Tax=Juglans microcarpa x Juglans regia TaxID=2249226 RepID=UPI001B7E0CB9|nr:uncharacterized protein LOC121262371 isoform X2 [Juglans microcarpa x Juglans regia]
MALAEDDEDESFGDFHSASFPNLTVHSFSTQISLRKSSSSSSSSPVAWGEFSTTPKWAKSKLPGCPAHTLSPRTNNSNEKELREPGWVNPGEARWVKPTGALPLSIFGEFEEEEEEKGGSAAEATVPYVANVLSNHKRTDSGRKGSDLNRNNLIANLFNQNQQIKTHNGPSLNSNVSELSTNGSNFNLNWLYLNPNGLGSDLVEGNDRFDDDDEYGEWEFKAAKAESRIGNGDSIVKFEGKVLENTDGARLTFAFGNGVRGPGDLLVESKGTSPSSGESDLGSDFNSSHMSKQDGFISGFFSKSKDNVNAKVELQQNFWELEDAFLETGSKYKLEEPKVTNTSLDGGEAQTFDGNGVVSRDDLFAVSDGISPSSRKLASGFNFNQSCKNGSISGSYFTSNQNAFVSSLGDENVGGINNFWESKDSCTESGLKHKSEEPKAADISPVGVEALTSNVNWASNSKHPLVASDGISHQSAEWEVEFNFNPASTQEDMISGSYSKSKQNGFNSSLIDENDESDDNFGEFKDAFSETGSKHERNEIGFKNHREPLPMSIFSDGNLDLDESSILQDISSVTPISNPRDAIKSPSSNMSINDIISSLYSQAEQSASFKHTSPASDYRMHSNTMVFESDLVNGDDDFDNGSWDFKAAGSETRAEDRTSDIDLRDSRTTLSTALELNDCVDLYSKLKEGLVNSDDDFDDGSWDFKAAGSETRAEDRTSDIDLGDSQKTLSTALELNDCIDFYSKLKDELCSIALYHLDNLKKAQSTAVLSGEEAKAKSLDEDVQKLYNELHKDNLISTKEVRSENLSAGEIHLNEFLEVLLETKFQVLESEFQISRRLPLAEKDARSAIELLKDVASTLAILKLGSVEEQEYYVSTWSSILSVCAQELKHGVSIWKQSLQKNVQSQILSEPEGKRYILAVGEIYRVIEVIRASTKLYKPWIFLNSGDATGLYSLLSECYSIWSGSGLEDALKSIGDDIGVEYDETVRALQESIKYIHDIDAVTLQNHIFSDQPICRLSALTASAVPGLKLVVWNGEHYFVTLANLWANLICPDPPKLPQIHGS